MVECIELTSLILIGISICIYRICNKRDMEPQKGMFIIFKNDKIGLEPTIDKIKEVRRYKNKIYYVTNKKYFLTEENLITEPSFKIDKKYR